MDVGGSDAVGITEIRPEFLNAEAGLIDRIAHLVQFIGALQEERNAEPARLARIRLASPHFAKRAESSRSAAFRAV